MGVKWTVRESDAGLSRDLARRLSISEALSSILVARGLADADSARLFLTPRLEGLHDPFENGRQRPARPAPLGPEVDEYGFVASDQLVERCVGSRDRVLSQIVGRRAALTSSVMS